MSVNSNSSSGLVIKVVALAMRHRESGKFMLARRSPGSSGAGQWEFPGGKIELSESPEQALIREIQEELSFDLQGVKVQFVAQNTHDYGNRKIQILLYFVEVQNRPQFSLVDHDKLDWFDLKNIEHVNLSVGDKYFIPLLNSI